MIEKERKIYDSVMASLVAKETKLEGVGDLVDYINSLQKRIADLEKLVFWSMIALAGEGYFTPELRETTKKTGYYSKIHQAGVV